ncbi:sensor histidine kinase [Actinoallomurus spadix]|uniref:Oxygen sensor histidine kinase NreB n=1 Tax=Actinoallomurus spadix TaxID=79912 RepID=A0ABP3GPX7_9ACTN|nr:sensor histidine kinase [Actinoallomurus spadix]MCO5989011.1 sensor histidine kinase [Actinoallomurus spadix]
MAVLSDGLDRPSGGLDRREAILLRVIPYGALAVSTVLVLLADAKTPAQVWATLGLAAAAAAWMLIVALPGTSGPGPRLGGFYYAGQLVLFALLILRSPLFGLFGWTGYVQVVYLRGRWKQAGVVATALIVSVTYIGGFQSFRAATVPVYLILAVATGAVGMLFTVLEMRRRAILDRLAEANASLKVALEENAGLHAQLLIQAREAGVLDERQRMAREIHDTLAQGLTGIVAQLEAARQNPTEWRRYADQAQALARENLAEARRSVQALRSPHLENARLPEAITGLSERWATTSGVPVGVEVTGEARPMLPDVEVALFRVAQEALTNVAKHAGASRVGLTLSYLDDVVLLDVRDDGVGFDPAAGGPGFGLTSMRQRLLRVAGRLEVESSPGEGTAINATVPALAAGAHL